jgi:hypothetical protein
MAHGRGQKVSGEIGTEGILPHRPQGLEMAPGTASGVEDRPLQGNAVPEKGLDLTHRLVAAAMRVQFFV